MVTLQRKSFVDFYTTSIITGCQEGPSFFLNENRSHLGSLVLDVVENLGIQLLCLPVHCSHELQPLDKSFLKPLKSYWNDAEDNCRRQHPGRPLVQLQFPKLFTQAWIRAATPSNALSGFRSTGIYPYNQNVIPVTAFAPSNVSDRPVEQAPSIPAQNKHSKIMTPLRFHSSIW
jgi:hypothetical protein